LFLWDPFVPYSQTEHILCRPETEFAAIKHVTPHHIPQLLSKCFPISFLGHHFTDSLLQAGLVYYWSTLYTPGSFLLKWVGVVPFPLLVVCLYGEGDND
jgi:hypothetical protein